MTDTYTIHHTTEKHPDLRFPDPHHDTFSKTVFGFWVYLMTDCILFTTLFIAYAVLSPNTFGGPTPHEIFHLPKVFLETILLLISSVTCGFAMLSAVKSYVKPAIFWLFISALLGVSFLYFEVSEFVHLNASGKSWRESAFLSSFFTLVGTHGLHIFAGTMWALILVAQLAVHGLTKDTFRRLVIFTLFWHFLELIWIFVFTFVYLMGAL